MKSSNYRGKLYQGTAEICSNYRKFELWRVELRRFFIKGLYRNFEGTEESSSNYREFELWRFDCIYMLVLVIHLLRCHCHHPSHHLLPHHRTQWYHHHHRHYHHCCMEYFLRKDQQHL